MTEVQQELIGFENLQKEFNVTCENNTTYIKKGKCIIKIKLPIKTTPEIASLFGHALGDGHIKKDKNQFQYFNKAKELTVNVVTCIKQIFSIEPTLHFRDDSEIYCIYAPSIVARILVMLGAPEGRKTTRDFRLPEWIVKGSVEVKKAFIRALFDDEGWVGITQSSFAIGFGQNKKESLIENHRIYMNQIVSIIYDLGIKTSEIFKRSSDKDSIQLGFKIMGRDNIKKFLDQINFIHNIKQEKLSKILNQYKQFQYGKKEAKLKILEVLKNGQLRSKRIGELLSRDQKTIWKHLNQLRKRNLVAKIGTKNKVFWKLNDLNTPSEFN